MFSNWQKEKATTALVDEAQAVADRLAGAKLHVIDSYAATARFWAGFHEADGLNLYEMVDWKPAGVKRFAAASVTKIAALRKQRVYDSSDGLAVWLHTARAIAEPRIAPAARDIWRLLSAAGPNADGMADDLLQEAGLPVDQGARVPKGFASDLSA